MSSRILVVGAGRTGAGVLRQLQKNPDLTLIVVDAHPEPYAVEQGVIEAVDYQETLTPLTLDFIIKKTEPDIILMTTTTEDLSLGSAPALDLLTEALQEEVASISTVPVLQIKRLSG